MSDRWECRYSSCEMMYLEIVGREVRCYLDHSPKNADVFTFDEVLVGKADGVVANIFRAGTIDELKAAVRAATAAGGV
jgi:hypothetical protein